MRPKIYIFLFLPLFLLLGFRGDTAKNFKLMNLDSKPVELKEVLKKGPVILDFWATWCKPCLKAFPELESLYQKYKDRGLTVLAVNTDGPRNQARVKPFVSSLKVSFPVVIDANGEVMRQYRVQVLPTTYLIAPDGEIVIVNYGYRPDKMKELEKLVKNLLPAASAEQ